MKQAAIEDIENNDPEDGWEELLLAHPKFLAQVAEARRALRAGGGITIESLRAEETAETVASQSNIAAPPSPTSTP